MSGGETNEKLRDLTKRVDKLEQDRSWVLGFIAGIGAMIGFLGQAMLAHLK